MQNAAGDGVAQAPHDQNAAYRAVVSDLVSLVEHVQNEPAADRTDDRPRKRRSAARKFHQRHRARRRISRYMKAAAALQACDVNLGIALRCPAGFPDIADHRASADGRSYSGHGVDLGATPARLVRHALRESAIRRHP